MSSSRLNRPDTLELHELAVDCRLGIHEWEQRSPQTVWVDLELPIDAARAAARDDSGPAVD
jgi:FolB domain-containing protein